jgi:2-phospho-L-lactate guanylyltransferase
MTRDAIVMPLKRFDVAKDRLRQAGAVDVTQLAEDLALGVLRSCRPRHVVVLSESDEISQFAVAHGAEAWRSQARSLNEAVQGAYAALRDRFDRLLVVHGDLASPEGLGQFQPGPGITIVADRHRAGTNVLVVPTGLDFHFAYGPDSMRLHQAEAERLGVSWRVIDDSPWRFDVDDPSDLKRHPDSI